MTQKRKRVSKFVYPGLGFPVELRNVDLVRFRSSWAPDVKLNKLSRDAFLALATKPAPLTGDEVHFIRQRLGMTLQAFAERLHVTYQAVMKWERSGDRGTGMSWGTEVAIRLSILDAADLSPKRFLDAYRAVADLTLGAPEDLVMVHDPEDPDLAAAGFDFSERGRCVRSPPR